MVDPNTPTADGKDHLANDSKLGVLVGGVTTFVVDNVLDGAIETLTKLDTSGWSGWWVTLIAAGAGTLLGALTAYKAKRERNRVR